MLITRSYCYRSARPCPRNKFRMDIGPLHISRLQSGHFVTDLSCSYPRPFDRPIAIFCASSDLEIIALVTWLASRMQVGGQKTRPSFQRFMNHYGRFIVFIGNPRIFMLQMRHTDQRPSFSLDDVFFHTCLHGELNILQNTPRWSSDMNAASPFKSLIRMSAPTTVTSRPACHLQALQYRARIHHGAKSQRYSASNGSGCFTPRARLATSTRRDPKPH